MPRKKPAARAVVAPIADGDQLLLDMEELREQHARLLRVMAAEDECRKRLADAQRVVRNINSELRRLKLERAAVVSGVRRRNNRGG